MTWSAYCSAARAIRSAIVFDPDAPRVAPAAIDASYVSCGQAAAETDTRCAGGFESRQPGRSPAGAALRGRCQRPTGGLREAGDEERLVDLALEDRDAELHALADDLPSIETSLSRQFGRSQVN